MRNGGGEVFKGNSSRRKWRGSAGFRSAGGSDIDSAGLFVRLLVSLLTVARAVTLRRTSRTDFEAWLSLAAIPAPMYHHEG